MVDDASSETTEIEARDSTVEGREAPQQHRESKQQRSETVTQPRKSTKTHIREEREVEDTDENDYITELKAEAVSRRKETQEQKKRAETLEKQLAELQKQIEASKEAYESDKKRNTDRLVRVHLSGALTKAGCVDPDTALSLLTSQVKFTDDGDVKNGDDLVLELKKTKPYFFTGPATTNPGPVPRPHQKPVSVKDMDDNEFDRLLKTMGVKTH